MLGTLRGRALSNVLLQDVRSGHERGDADRVLDGVTLLQILTGIIDCRGARGPTMVLGSLGLLQLLRGIERLVIGVFLLGPGV